MDGVKHMDGYSRATLHAVGLALGSAELEIADGRAAIAACDVFHAIQAGESARMARLIAESLYVRCNKDDRERCKVAIEATKQSFTLLEKDIDYKVARHCG